MTLVDRDEESLHLAALLTSAAAHYYGVYPATVSDNQDPDGQGRVKVRLPWSPDPSGAMYDIWARLATTMAGGSRGTWFIPDIGDEVLVSFEAGEPGRPYVVGALWNGQDSPPVAIDSENDVKAIVSRTGIRLTMDDTQGAVLLKLETPGGQKITLTDTPPAIVVEDSSGNSCRLESQGITVTAAAKVTINAATAEIDAGMVTVNAGMSKFSGVIQCDAIIANTVIGASYTPGAGNIW